MTSQVQKNQKLLAELSSLGQIKRKYESSRTALILCVLVVVIVNYFLTLEWWMHLIGIAITSFIAFVCYKSYLTLQKVNLREKYNIGKRASDDYTSTSTPSTEQLYANQPTDSTSGPGTGSKPSTRGNSGSSTTKSPIVLSSSALRNRLHGAPGRSPDYQSRDSSTPSRPLAKDNVQDILRQSSMFDSSNTSRTANFIYGSNTPSESPSHHQYNLSPLVAGPSSKPTPNTFRSIDALQALQLRQINDDWVERLRELLGRDLCKIVKLFDESVEELLAVLRRANVPADALAKAENVLEFRASDGKDTSSSTTGNITVEEILKFAQQVGVHVETLHKYEQTSTFMKLCQWLIELRNTSNATSFYPKAVMTSLFFSSGANQVVGEGNAKKRLTPMIDRLRDMARESKDAGLNIHWMNMDITQILLTGRVEHEIYDQEVAMALFLNRCDSFATTRSAAGVGMFGMSERFSKSHYAMGLLDLRQRLRPYYVTANASSANRTRMPVILLQRSAQDNDAMKEAGFMSPKTSSDSASVSSAGTKPPHFDVVRISPQGQYYEELFSIDASREDVFESMIVFMLMIYLSSQESAEDDEQEEEEEEERKQDLSTLAGSFDYRVIKPILEEIIGKDELQVMMDQVSLPAAFSANSGASTNASIYGSTGKTASPNPRHPISPHLNHSRLSSSSFSSATKPTVGEGMGSSSKFNFTSSSLPTHHHNKAATPSTIWSSAKKIPLHSNMFGGNTTAAGATPSSGLKSAQRNTSHLDQSYHQGNMSRFYSSVGSPQ